MKKMIRKSFIFCLQFGYGVENSIGDFKGPLG
jgi:hypothetical protein